MLDRLIAGLLIVVAVAAVVVTIGGRVPVAETQQEVTKTLALEALTHALDEAASAAPERP